MSLILSLLLTTSSIIIHTQNGETGVLIGVQTYHLSHEKDNMESLYLCQELLARAENFQAQGISTYMKLGELGKFRLLQTECGTFQLEGYKTRIYTMECATSDTQEAIEPAILD